MLLKKIYGLCLLLTLFISTAHAQQSTQENDALTKQNSKNANAYLDTLFDMYLFKHPEFATSLGKKYNYHLWENRTETGLLQDCQFLNNGLNTLLSRYPEKNLDAQTKLTIEIFKTDLQSCFDRYKWRLQDYAISHLEGAHKDPLTLLISYHSIANESDAEAYATRINTFDKVLEETGEWVKKQTEAKTIIPRFSQGYVISDIKTYIQKLSSDKDDNIILNDFKTKVNALNLTDSRKKNLIEKVQVGLTTKVVPAYKKLLALIESIYINNNNNNGAWGLQNGEAYYKYKVNQSIGMEITPDSIFNVGIAEVARLHKEIEIVKKQLNKDTMNTISFIQWVKTADEYKYPNNENGRKILFSRADSFLKVVKQKLPEYFNTFPKAECVVLAVEPYREATSPGAFYEHPPLDNSKPGKYYVNLSNMDAEKVYELEALTYHEAIPGHHMQIAISQELTDLPNFRKFSYNNAFIEGWALYSEKLAKEMGLYQNTTFEIGRIAFELYRSARLVVDVGIHYKKWTREQAIDYMNKNTMNSYEDCVREIERYFMWPGQATGYKIGMLTILALREQAKQELKEKFDIKKFHDVILTNAALPLSVLKKQIAIWINNSK